MYVCSWFYCQNLHYPMNTYYDNMTLLLFIISKTEKNCK